MSQGSDKRRAGAQFRGRPRKIRRSPGGPLGIAEVIGLGVAALMLLSVIVGYLYFQVPAKSRVTNLTRERDLSRQQLRAKAESFKQGVDTNKRVLDITESLAKFEDERLADRDGGRIALYEDLNQLMHQNGLRNTSGPTYAALDPLGQKTQGQATAAATSANKWLSIYPGIGVNVTVEGQYQNIRHFVRDIESSKEFIIINAVELERATENALVATEAGGPKASNALVSLRLDMATYFSRPAQANEKPAANVH